MTVGGSWVCVSVYGEDRGLYFLFLGGGVESAEIHVGRTCLLPAASFHLTVRLCHHLGLLALFNFAPN